MTLKINSDTSIEEVEKQMSVVAKKSTFDSSKYLGKMKLRDCPVELQESLRNEWA